MYVLSRLRLANVTQLERSHSIDRAWVPLCQTIADNLGALLTSNDVIVYRALLLP